MSTDRPTLTTGQRFLASSPTSLDSQETKSPRSGAVTYGIEEYSPWRLDNPRPTQIELDFRHSGWKVDRDSVFRAMQRLCCSHRKLEAFWSCGNSAWLQVREDGQAHRVVSNDCHHRWCQPCQRARATFIRDNLARHLEDRPVRFLTLTLRHNETPLIDQIDRLYRSFLAFRRRRSWNSHVTGGAAFLELKLGRDGRWHPHFHCIIEGSYWSTKDISSEWLAVTGDSSIIDIRAVENTQTVCYYVTKYLTKCIDQSIYKLPEKLDEAMNATSGRRLVFTFASWRGIKLTPKRDPDSKHAWSNVASLESIWMNAAAGDEKACFYKEIITGEKNHSGNNTS